MVLLKQITMTFLRGVERILNFFTETMLFGAAACLCVIILSIVFEIVARFLFASPTFWVSDLVVYLLLTTVFLALPKVTSEAGHVSITILSEFLPQSFSTPLGRLILLVAAATTFLLALVTGVIAVRQFGSGTMTMGAFPIPRYALTATMCLGFGLSALHFLRSSFSGIKSMYTA